MALPIQRLEQYSLRYPQDVLRLRVQKATGTDQGEDEILVFKGFSSSLVFPTDTDPDIPLVTEADHILSLDRLASPYQGEATPILEGNIPWEIMAQRLQALDIL